MGGARRVGATRAGSAALAAVVLSVLAACGTELTRAEVERAAGVTRTVETTPGPAASTETTTTAADTPAAAAGATETAPNAATAPTSVLPNRAAASGSSQANSNSAGRTTPAGKPGGGTAAAPAGRAAPRAATGTPAQSGAGPAPAPPAAALSPIVVGNIGDYSGVAGSSIAGGQTMAQVIVRAINDGGGLNGHPVKLITADAAADPSRYLALAKDMVENQRAIAFVGNMLPISAPGADRYLADKRIPIIGGEGTHSLWSTSPNMFFQGTSFRDIVVATAKAAADRKLPKIADFVCVEADPCRVSHEVLTGAEAKRVGAEVVYSAQVSLTQPDYTAECLQARNRGAQAIVMVMDAASLRRVARSCVQQGYRPQFITLSLALTSSLAKDSNLDGIVAPVPTFPWFAGDLPGAVAYQQAMQRYAPSLEPSPTTSVMWVVGELFKRAGAKLSANPTSAEFYDALWSIQGETLGGLAPPITFNKNAPASRTPCAFLVQSRDGKWTAPAGSKPVCS